MMDIIWRLAFVLNVCTHVTSVFQEWIVRHVPRDCNYKVVNADQLVLKGLYIFNLIICLNIQIRVDQQPAPKLL